MSLSCSAVDQAVVVWHFNGQSEQNGLDFYTLLDFHFSPPIPGDLWLLSICPDNNKIGDGTLCGIIYVWSDTLPEAVSSSEHFTASAACNLLLVVNHHVHVPWETSTVQPESLNGNQPWEHPGWWSRPHVHWHVICFSGSSNTYIFFILALTADSSRCRLHIPHAHCHLFFPCSSPCVPINLLPLVHKACPFQLLHGVGCPVLLPSPPHPSPRLLPPAELRLTHSVHTQPRSH